MTQTKSAPPILEDEGRRSGRLQSARETSNASGSVAIQAQTDKGRSSAHPCWYRVGSLGREAVYWHPVSVFAREVDYSYLVTLTALSGVAFRLSGELLRDLDTNPALWGALPGVLQQAVFDREDIEWAAECERERAGMVAAANASLIWATGVGF